MINKNVGQRIDFLSINNLMFSQHFKHVFTCLFVWPFKTMSCLIHQTSKNIMAVVVIIKRIVN